MVKRVKVIICPRRRRQVRQKIVLRAERRSVFPADAFVSAIGSQYPGALGVAQVGIEQRVPQIAAQGFIFHRTQRLDPPVQVPLHQIRAADVHLRFAAVLEGEDPRVLEEPPDD